MMTDDHFVRYVTKNFVISPNILVWKFCGKAQFRHSFGWIRWNLNIFRRFAIANVAYRTNWSSVIIIQVYTSLFVVIFLEDMWKEDSFRINQIYLIPQCFIGKHNILLPLSLTHTNPRTDTPTLSWMAH